MPRQTTTLSPANRRVLAGIRAYWREFGIPPTVRDIRARVGCASTATVNWHLVRLERLGLIVREPGIARSIRVVQPQPEERTPNASNVSP